MRRRTFLTLGTEGIKASEAIAGDICLYNKSSKDLLIIKNSEFNVDLYPLTKYTAIGIVVIPGTHNVYGTGECAVMSLNSMSDKTPDYGSSEYHYQVHYGWHGVGSFDLCKVPYANNGSTLTKTIQGMERQVYPPSDSNGGGVQDLIDTDTYHYHSSIWSNSFYGFSPYKDDDSRNSLYYKTSTPSSTENAQSDFNGKSKTKQMLSFHTSQTDWKTATTIKGQNTNCATACCCCWRYHTEGTKQGDWYLPAMGELGYIPPKFKMLNNLLDKISSEYNITNCCKIYSYESLLSTTSFKMEGYGDSVFMKKCYGSMGMPYGEARAFLRVK